MSKPRYQASDTVTLMLSLVPYLREHSPVSVDDVAKHFGVERRHVKNAIDLLVMTGVPDRNGDVYAGEMFDIDFDLYDEGAGEISLTHSVVLDGTPKLSALEAAAVLASLNTMLAAAAPASETHARLLTLINKVKSGSSINQAAVNVVPVIAPSSISSAVTAIEKDLQMDITYQGPDGKLQPRTIDPLQVSYIGQSWFLRAWCHLRSAQRTFRGDRIIVANLREDPRCPDHVAVEVADSLFAESDSDIIATVKLPHWVMPQIAGYGPQVLEILDDQVIVSIRFATVSSALRLVARQPGKITVISPNSLRHEVANWASTAG